MTTKLAWHFFPRPFYLFSFIFYSAFFILMHFIFVISIWTKQQVFAHFWIRDIGQDFQEHLHGGGTQFTCFTSTKVQILTTTVEDREGDPFCNFWITMLFLVWRGSPTNNGRKKKRWKKGKNTPKEREVIILLHQNTKYFVAYLRLTSRWSKAGHCLSTLAKLSAPASLIRLISRLWDRGGRTLVTVTPLLQVSLTRQLYCYCKH